MSITFKTTSLDKVSYNGANVENVYFNGIKVFEKTPALADPCFKIKFKEPATYVGFNLTCSSEVSVTYGSKVSVYPPGEHNGLSLMNIDKFNELTIEGGVANLIFILSETEPDTFELFDLETLDGFGIMSPSPTNINKIKISRCSNLKNVYFSCGMEEIMLNINELSILGCNIMDASGDDSGITIMGVHIDLLDFSNNSGEFAITFGMSEIINANIANNTGLIQFMTAFEVGACYTISNAPNLYNIFFYESLYNSLPLSDSRWRAIVSSLPNRTGDEQGMILGLTDLALINNLNSLIADKNWLAIEWVE